MRVIDLGGDILLFQAEPPPGALEGLNFLALSDGSRVLFVDVGYAENMEEALRLLSGLGHRPVGAIISHYHPDHADGLALLEGIETWGSVEYGETLRQCFGSERHASLAPVHAVSGPESLRFGRHRLELVPLGGHSPDSLGVLLDERVFYAADLLLFTNDGQPVLPSVHDRPVERHAEALRRLTPYLGYLFVPGHGAPVASRLARERDLANRLAYIEAIAARPGLSLELSQAACEPKFLGSSWHEENWK